MTTRLPQPEVGPASGTVSGAARKLFRSSFPEQFLTRARMIHPPRLPEAGLTRLAQGLTRRRPSRTRCCTGPQGSRWPRCCGRRRSWTRDRSSMGRCHCPKNSSTQRYHPHLPNPSSKGCSSVRHLLSFAIFGNFSECNFEVVEKSWGMRFILLREYRRIIPRTRRFIVRRRKVYCPKSFVSVSWHCPRHSTY